MIQSSDESFPQEFVATFFKITPYISLHVPFLALPGDNLTTLAWNELARHVGVEKANKEYYEFATVDFKGVPEPVVEKPYRDPDVGKCADPSQPCTTDGKDWYGNPMEKSQRTTITRTQFEFVKTFLLKRASSYDGLSQLDSSHADFVENSMRVMYGALYCSDS